MLGLVGFPFTKVTSMVNVTRLQMVSEYTIPYNKKPLDSTEAAIEVICDVCRSLTSAPQEEVWVLTVDTQRVLIQVHPVHKGTVNSASCYPRDIFQRVILDNATSFFLVHNHPSGIIIPSEEYIKFTKRIQLGSELLGLTFDDHIIVTESNKKPVGRSIRQYMGVW